MFLGDSTFGYLRVAMDITQLRQNVIASNIANADTPGYREKYVPFKDVLSEIMCGKKLELKVTDPRHIRDNGSCDLGALVRFGKGEYLSRNDRNNVKLDEEMYRLAKNTILYNTLVGFERYKIREYLDVISSSNNI